MLKRVMYFLVGISIIGLPACGSDDKNSTELSPSSQDITDIIFTNAAGSCSEYAGTYESNVTDVKRGIGFMGNVTITLSNSTCTITSNTIPNHNFNDANAQFATDAAEVSKTYALPFIATAASNITELSLGTTNAIFLNGVVLDILPAACYDVGGGTLGNEKIGCGQDQINNPWRYDPMSSLNSFGTDSHNAHVQPDGTYHYHGNPVAMFTQNCDTQINASPVIGFAADGYPIFGMCIKDGNTIRKVTSSYALKTGARVPVALYTTPTAGQGVVQSNNYDGQFRGDWVHLVSTGDLDACNGMTVNGQYGYYITDTFPWAINCYKGAVQSSFSARTSSEIINKAHAHYD